MRLIIEGLTEQGRAARQGRASSEPQSSEGGRGRDGEGSTEPQHSGTVDGGGQDHRVQVIEAPTVLNKKGEGEKQRTRQSP